VNTPERTDAECANITTRYAFRSATHFSIAESNLILPNSRLSRLFQLTAATSIISSSFLLAVAVSFVSFPAALSARYICSLHVETSRSCRFKSRTKLARNATSSQRFFRLKEPRRNIYIYISVVFFPRDSSRLQIKSVNQARSSLRHRNIPLSKPSVAPRRAFAAGADTDAADTAEERGVASRKNKSHRKDIARRADR